MDSGDRDGVMVLGFFFEVAEEGLNILDDMWNGDTSSAGYWAKGSTVNFSELYDHVKGSDYYTYMGSFTTPYCNEIVKWVVFKEPLPVSEHQLKLLRNARNYIGMPMSDNFRHTQPL